MKDRTICFIFLINDYFNSFYRLGFLRSLFFLEKILRYFIIHTYTCGYGDNWFFKFLYLKISMTAISKHLNLYAIEFLGIIWVILSMLTKLTFLFNDVS